jgi:hypothetical protein
VFAFTEHCTSHRLWDGEMGGAAHVAHMGAKRNAYRALAA